jgi:FkbM family methyltransferase
MSNTGRDGPYFSQFGEDQWIDKNLPWPANGVFVDVGASDGITGSNTFFFERAGWDGLCIDADPRHTEELKQRRRLVEACAVAALTGTITFHLHKARPTLSGIDGSGDDYAPINVPCFTLHDLLTRHRIGVIDILDIDVEGAELMVWQSFNPDLHRPRLVIIEYAPGRPRSSREEIRHAVEGCAYHLVHETCANLLFVRTKEEEGGHWASAAMMRS